MRGVVCLMLLLSACSPSECAGILLPPPELDHRPLFPVRIAEVPSEVIGDHCFALGAQEHDRIACYRVGSGMLLPQINGRDVTRVIQSCLEQHENGHVNDAEMRTDHKGWR